MMAVVWQVLTEQPQELDDRHAGYVNISYETMKDPKFNWTLTTSEAELHSRMQEVRADTRS